MHVEFRRAVIPDEVPELLAFDRKVFRKADLFDEQDWMKDETYWMLVDGTKIGCCAFQANRDFRDDICKDRRNPSRKGSLYITTTGILRRFRGSGFGKLFKVWQITYAKLHGFNRIVTNCRLRNAPIIGLNQSLGFRLVRATPRYHTRPTVVMELKI